MKSELLVICDSQAGYAKKLAGYFRKKACHYEIQVFTDSSVFLAAAEQMTVKALLIGEDIFEILRNEKKTEKLQAEKLLVLTERRDYKQKEKEEAVYKYQSGEAILYCLVNEGLEAAEINKEKGFLNRTEMIGIYSPVTNVLKTSFAMTLGQILAEEEEVLFISLECCSGLTGLLSLNKERDLSDLLYERSVGEARFSLGRFTQRAEGLSIISPVDGVTELQSVKKEEWVKLMRFLLREGSYSKLILDIGNSVNGIIEILQLCGMIYMPYRQDRISMAKLSAFETCIDRYEAAQDLKKKIKKLKMPYFENLEESLVELKYGAFGSFVRTILSK